MSTDYSSAAPQASRRNFLKLGLFGSFALATAGSGTLTGCASNPKPLQDARTGRHYLFLTQDDVVMLQGLIPVVLAGTLPDDPQTRERETAQLIELLDQGIDTFSDANRAEIRKLFDLLTFAPTRALVAGLWSSWEKAHGEQIDKFLNNWRHSSLGLFNQGYGALVKMIALVEYGMEENWARSGYMGPPAYATQTLPQFRYEV